jgi:hypothetical protein
MEHVGIDYNWWGHVRHNQGVKGPCIDEHEGIKKGPQEGQNRDHHGDNVGIDQTR